MAKHLVLVVTWDSGDCEEIELPSDEDLNWLAEQEKLAVRIKDCFLNGDAVMWIDPDEVVDLRKARRVQVAVREW